MRSVALWDQKLTFISFLICFLGTGGATMESPFAFYTHPLKMIYAHPYGWTYTLMQIIQLPNINLIFFKYWLNTL